MTAELPYEEFEHPADIGLRVRGSSLAELFRNAARGMIELMLEPGTVTPRDGRPITATGDDAEMMLVGWLEEILFAFDADGFAPCEVEVERFEAGRVSGTLRGEPFDETVHEVRNVIKAVTWHGLKVEKQGDTYRVNVLFDV